MTEEDGRPAVVAEAKSWIGTPYHPHARLKRIGVDCAQIVLMVYANLGLIEAYDPEPYSQQWHLHRDGERYVMEVLKFAQEIPVEAARPADVILFKYGRAFSHGGILIEPNRIVHAVQRDGCVLIGELDRDGDLAAREKRAFSYWAVDHGR